MGKISVLSVLIFGLISITDAASIEININTCQPAVQGACGFGPNGEARAMQCLYQFALNKSEYVPNETMTLQISGSAESASEGSVFSPNPRVVGCSTVSPIESLNLVARYPGSQFVSGSISATTIAQNVVGTHLMPLSLTMFLESIQRSVTRNGNLSYTVSAPITQCSDRVNNNDGDNLIDTLDPQCHTDCNVNNIATYLATHNSESVAPNGIICPAPTLQLNGRAAFFQVVKNFFASITARAFAGE